MLLNVLFLTMIFFLMNYHPLMLGSLLIIQSLSLAFILTQMFHMNLYSYFLFMIYLGGILMIFSYIIMISYKEPLLKFKVKNIFFMFIFIFMYSSSYETSIMPELVPSTTLNTTVISIYSEGSSFILVLLITLLVIMIEVVYITENSKGSMRAKK